MNAPSKNISVSQFKAKCLAILDEMSKTSLTVIVTKRGKPIAKIIPMESAEPLNLLGSVHYKNEKDILAPVDETWEAEQ
jgi:prevent-host-death family protein